MDVYFPDLSSKASAIGAVDEYITATLFIGDVPGGVVSTRYQYQTWGGTRSPERRITGNLSALRNKAKAGDYLVIERSISDPSFYRLTLLEAGTPAYAEFEVKTAGRRWGAVDPEDSPVTEETVIDAEKVQTAHEEGPLDLFDNDAALTESRTWKVARSRVFQTRVRGLYGFQCAVCGLGLRSPAGTFEVEAAHIVPRGLKGADDARNGLALCRSHHWAFDSGLFGVVRGQIHIPAKVSAIADNAHLVAFGKKALRPPSVVALAPAPAALEWHMEMIVARHL